MDQPERVEIPNRSLFRPPEVCEIASLQLYVLRSWEAEFPDLGVSKAQGGPRVYRRSDVERVLRIKHLLFVEGLTLAGARRRLTEERPAAEEPALASLSELLGKDARERIAQVKNGLRALAAMLSRRPGKAGAGGSDGFELRAATPPPPTRSKTAMKKLAHARKKK
jgi:DNA-binding transcriptional MerR regulator